MSSLNDVYLIEFPSESLARAVSVAIYKVFNPGGSNSGQLFEVEPHRDPQKCFAVIPGNLTCIVTRKSNFTAVMQELAALLIECGADMGELNLLETLFSNKNQISIRLIIPSALPTYTIEQALELNLLPEVVHG